VNISARQFAEDGLYEQIDGALSRYGIAAERLTLEITESVLMEHVDIADRQMQRLHERGVRFSVDDFGTGYSSLAYLSRFPISELKIDRSFAKELSAGSADSGDQMIVRSVIALGHNLGLSVVSEGVENSAQARMLTQFCCDEAQGYHFARPLPVGEAVRAAASRTASTATS
jgi:EAL domain-containing protein (putative c-di-GMP-specific phosphodiesterase class I)